MDVSHVLPITFCTSFNVFLAHRRTVLHVTKVGFVHHATKDSISIILVLVSYAKNIVNHVIPMVVLLAKMDTYGMARTVSLNANSLIVKLAIEMEIVLYAKLDIL